MQYSLQYTQSFNTGECLVIPIIKGRQQLAVVKTVDQQTDGLIKELIKSGDITSVPGKTQWLHAPRGIKLKRILCVGIGELEKLTLQKLSRIYRAIHNSLKESAAKKVVISLLPDGPIELEKQIQTLVKVIDNANYKFSDFKSSYTKSKKSYSHLVMNISTKKQKAKHEAALHSGIAVAKGMELTKNLGNMPPNICHPTYLASQAKKLAKEYQSISVDVLNEADMKKLKMNSFLSVSKGSEQPAKLIAIHYKGSSKKTGKPHVFVGKGITFDTGGTSIKPSAAMDEMKYDMCGAASVFGLMKACAELDIKTNVVGLIAAAENMPGGKASRPGDIVKSMSGRTIEILNTDAEGRLVLCDTLTYAQKLKPKTLVDIATLTGACIVALGHHTSGMMANDDDLANDLVKAGLECDDRVWQLPLYEEYNQQLSSPFADMANIGGRSAGTITAGCFLSRFTEDMRWAHLDIAGTAWVSGKNKGATGRPVPLLVEFLQQQTKA